MIAMKTVRGRLAPSPSGRMHLGNALSALIAWLSVRSAGGEMVLRIEDLDPDRCGAEYTQLIQKDFKWLGLDWDELSQFQSARSQIYSRHFDMLSDLVLIYPCYCSRASLNAASAPHASDGRAVYDGTCRAMSDNERTAQTKAPSYRVIVPDKTIEFTDGNLGFFSQNLKSACGDFIVRRADGVYAYQLAVTVDDALMGISQVVRGSDLLDSTPRQIYLHETLGYAPPEYYHTPLLLAKDLRRLSKRDRDMDFGVLKDRFSAPQIVGKLAELAGIIDKYEPVLPKDLISEFNWENVKKQNIVLKAFEI